MCLSHIDENTSWIDSKYHGHIFRHGRDQTNISLVTIPATCCLKFKQDKTFKSENKQTDSFLFCFLKEITLTALANIKKNANCKLQSANQKAKLTFHSPMSQEEKGIVQFGLTDVSNSMQ